MKIKCRNAIIAITSILGFTDFFEKNLVQATIVRDKTVKTVVLNKGRELTEFEDYKFVHGCHPRKR